MFVYAIVVLFVSLCARFTLDVVHSDVVVFDVVNSDVVPLDGDAKQAIASVSADRDAAPTSHPSTPEAPRRAAPVPADCWTPYTRCAARCETRMVSCTSSCDGVTGDCWSYCAEEEASCDRSCDEDRWSCEG